MALRNGAVLVCDDVLRQKVERFFYLPMIVLALAVLPLLVIEVMQLSQGWVQTAVDIAFSFIWVAFFVEFMLKIVIAESRFEYVRRNWLDLCVILVPFLRPLRLSTGLAKTTRMFKLRGVGMKMARHGVAAALGLGATEILLKRFGFNLRSGGAKPAESMTRYELIDEVKRLRRVHESWSKWYVAHNAHVARHGCCFPPDHPLLPRTAGAAEPDAAEPAAEPLVGAADEVAAVVPEAEGETETETDAGSPGASRAVGAAVGEARAVKADGCGRGPGVRGGTIR